MKQAGLRGHTSGMGSSTNRVCGHQRDREEEHGEKGVINEFKPRRRANESDSGRGVVICKHETPGVWLYVNMRLQGGRRREEREHRMLL